jgi:hypothetical protein
VLQNRVCLIWKYDLDSSSIYISFVRVLYVRYALVSTWAIFFGSLGTTLKSRCEERQKLLGRMCQCKHYYAGKWAKVRELILGFLDSDGLMIREGQLLSRIVVLSVCRKSPTRLHAMRGIWEDDFVEMAASLDFWMNGLCTVCRRLVKRIVFILVSLLLRGLLRCLLLNQALFWHLLGQAPSFASYQWWNVRFQARG